MPLGICNWPRGSRFHQRRYGRGGLIWKEKTNLSQSSPGCLFADRLLHRESAAPPKTRPGEYGDAGSRASPPLVRALLDTAQQVAESLNASLVDFRYIEPPDHAAVLALAREHEILVTLEDNVVAGGAGDAVNQLLAGHTQKTPS